MRLIDADRLKINLYHNKKVVLNDDLVKCIDDTETAYSVEKVVEELEEMIHPKQLYFCKYARGGCKHLYNDDKDCMECIVENAIEIVKEDGKNEN